MNFKSKTKLQNPEKKQKKKDILKNLYSFSDVRERVLDALKVKYFQEKLKVQVFQT